MNLNLVANILVNDVLPLYYKYGVFPPVQAFRDICEMRQRGEINNQGVKELIKHLYAL